MEPVGKSLIRYCHATEGNRINTAAVHGSRAAIQRKADMKKKETIRIVEGIGNVFAGLGFANLRFKGIDAYDVELIDYH